MKNRRSLRGRLCFFGDDQAAFTERSGLDSNPIGLWQAVVEVPICGTGR